MAQTLAPQDTCVLVTGGAGFIGSHTVVELLQRNYKVVVVDNFYNASPVALDRVREIVGPQAAENLVFYEADVNDRDALTKIFDARQPSRVIQFAAYKAVGESVSKPIEYYQNLNCTLVILDVMRHHNCHNFVFSSSATVYGDPASVPITEDFPTGATTNPYGWTKVMIERILMDLHTADPVERRAAALLQPHRSAPLGPHRRGPQGHPQQPRALRGAGGRGQAPVRAGLRRRLSHTRWHRRARLHPCGRPRLRPCRST